MSNTDLTYSQLESLWTQTASGTSYDTPAWSSLMAAIALAESSGNASNVNATDNGGAQSSYGLWQISNGTHTAPSADWATPSANAQLALQKLQSQGLSAWGTYTSGAYQQYEPTGTALPADASTTGGSTATTTGISLNPITWAEYPVKGFEWAGNWLTGGIIGDITTEASGLAGITQGLVGIVQTISKIGQLFLILRQPAFWLRVGAFFLGIIALLAGLRAMGESLK